VALSPDGKAVAVLDNKSAYLFDSATGKETRIINDVPGHSSLGCDFTPDGKEVVFAKYDGLLIVPVDPKQPTRHFPIRKGTILADSRRMITTVGDCVIRTYDLRTGKQLDDFSRFEPFNRVRFIGRHVAASWTHDGLIVTWDARTGRVLSEATLKPKAKHTPFYEVRFSPDGRHVAAWSETGLCVLAETATGKTIKEVTSTESRPIMAFFHPSRDEVAVEDPEQKRYRWVDLKTGKWTQTLPALVGRPIEVSADARTLLVNHNGAVCLCELATGKPRWRDPFDPKKASNEFNASNDTYKAALVRRGRGVLVVRHQNVTAFDVLTGRKMASFSFTDSQQGHTCATSADGRWLAIVRATNSSQTEPYVRLYDLASEEPSQPVFNAVLPCPQPYPAALALDADGSRLISAHYDGTCFVWDLKKLVPPTAKRTLADLWEKLGHADPAEARPAVTAFARDSAATVKLFASKLSPIVEVPPARIAGWAMDLDSEEQDRRVAAERGLAAARDQAEEALRAAVLKPLSLEQMRRAERLLKKIDPTTDAELLRQARAVEILEYAGSKEAITLLEKLAKGAPAARLTRDAKESLQRLKRSEQR
jgi:WD40 repeat protein